MEEKDIFKLMDAGGPTDSEKDDISSAQVEINRSKTLCHKANSMDPSDFSYMKYFDELFLSPLNEATILTPFYCDMGSRVKIGKKVFINDNVHLLSGGGIVIEDGAMISSGVYIVTVNHDVYYRHRFLTFKKVVIKKNAWICANATICPGVTIGENSVVAAGAVVTKDVEDNVIVGGNPAVVIKKLDPKLQKENW